MPLVLFNPQIGPYQVPPLHARAGLGAMAMKRCSAFPKAPALLGPHHQTVQCHTQDTRWAGSYPSAEKQSVYSTVIHRVKCQTVLFQIIQFSVSAHFRRQNTSISSNAV